MGYASRRRAKATELYCYTDESGNTGNNLFDAQQPFFWTATLVGQSTLSAAAAPAIASWLPRLGVPEIHGSAIRMRGIDLIAADLRALLIDQNCRLVFTRIGKGFHARLKLADTLLDSGNNKAVSNLHYGVRGLRMPLAHAIVASMTADDEQAFWSAYLAQDADAFRVVLVRVREAVDHLVQAPRMREILLDAFDWGVRYPNALFDGAGLYDSPNVVALTLLLEGLQRLLNGTPHRVLRFVHDEQNQFATSLHTTHAIGRRFRSDMAPASLITDISTVANIPAALEFVRSDTEPVLQIVDALLWMTKRAVQHNEVLTSACELLGQTVVERAVAMDFTRGSFAADAARMLGAVNRLPVSSAQLEAGKVIATEFEDSRLARRNEPPS